MIFEQTGGSPPINGLAITQQVRSVYVGQCRRTAARFPYGLVEMALELVPSGAAFVSKVSALA